MTASRTCRACGAELPGDVMWCLRCYEPIRQLTPRERGLPPIPARELIDPATVRPDHVPLRLERPSLSRTLGGPTSFGLIGRLAITSVVLAMMPLGGSALGGLTLVYLMGYVPLAAVVLRSTWAATPVESGRVLFLPTRRPALALRALLAAFGAAIAAMALASGGSVLAVIPGAVILTVAVTPIWHGVLVGVAEALEHPVTLVVVLNVLNVVDAAASGAAIRAGAAAELNPLVGRYGTGVKVVLVLGCSLVLLRVRPRALVWPIVAFAALSVYHFTGWLVMLGA